MKNHPPVQVKNQNGITSKSFRTFQNRITTKVFQPKGVIQMGWFSNTNTVQRAENNAILNETRSTLLAKHATLSRYHTKTSAGIQLLERASAVTPASSELGLEFARTINGLKMNANNLSQEIADAEYDVLVINKMIEQYQLPRGAREINVSGNEMAKAAFIQRTATELKQSSIQADQTLFMAIAAPTVQKAADILTK